MDYQVLIWLGKKVSFVNYQGVNMQQGVGTYQGHGFHNAIDKGKAAGTITVTSHSLQFESGNHQVQIPLAGASFKLGGASDRLVFIAHPNVPDWSIYTSDRSILKDPYLSDIPLVKAQLNKARTKRVFNWGLLIASVFIVVALPVFLLSNMDWVSAQIAEEMPVEWEVSLGETAYAQYQVGKQILQTEEGKAAITQLTTPLLAAIDSERYDFQIEVTNASDVNAFALPGGFIVINAGLILKADNANELLGVLAHEISHVTQQHGLRNMISTAGVFIVVDALFGDVSGLLAMLSNAAPLLINQSYSRKFEADADEMGLAYLEKANIDPGGLVTFFEKLMALEEQRLSAIGDEDTRSIIENAMGFLSTHPATSERIATIKDKIGSNGMPYVNHDKAFQQLKRNVQQFLATNEADL